MDLTYFYLRTKTLVGLDSESALNAFAAGFPYRIGKPIATRPEDINDRHEIEMIGFGKERITWGNGLIFRFESNVIPDEVERLIPIQSLEYFDEWTIFQPPSLFKQHGREVFLCSFGQ